ncbi:MAG TPA: hypothetical protein VGJ36_03795 [Gemmatimonadales bacterium]|jgi:hypothetical protein
MFVAETVRDRVVGVRVDRRTIQAIDLLIDAGVHETRSAAAAWLIRAGIEAQRDLLDRIATTAAQIRDLKVRAQAVTQARDE